jgi:hypothetical protein
MKVELSGANIDGQHNKCHTEGCRNRSCITVWGPSPSLDEIGTCAMCLKKNVDSGKWEISKGPDIIKAMKTLYADTVGKYMDVGIRNFYKR